MFSLLNFDVWLATLGIFFLIRKLSTQDVVFYVSVSHQKITLFKTQLCLGLISRNVSFGSQKRSSSKEEENGTK